MRIADLRLRFFRLPLKGALAWGRQSRLEALFHGLVEVVLEDGAVGRGEVAIRPTIYGETPESVAGALRHLKPGLLGRSVEDREGLAASLERLPCNFAARGGLDLALWEARARARGRPLRALLPPQRERVEVAYILGLGDEAGVLADAEFAYRRGVRVFKVKVGRDLAADTRRIERLRDRFPDAKLYADANETLPPEEAHRYLAAWRDLGLRYVEEPLPVERVRERAALRARGLLPLIADDSAFTPRDLERELALDTFDVLNVKPARTGLTASLAMLARARAAGKGTMVGSQAFSSFGAYHALLLALQDPVTEPSELAFHLKAEGGFFPFPPIREGFVYARDLPEEAFDEEAFAAYEVRSSLTL